jgi:hypothetical protein
MFKNQPYDMTEDEMMAADYHAKKGRDHGTRDAIHDMIVTLTEMALRHVIHSSGAHKERPGGPQEIDYHLAQHDREVYEALATLAGKLWRTAPEEYRRKLHQQIRPFNNVGVAGSPG